MAKQSTSKWSKYKQMRKSSYLLSHLPETHRLTEQSFSQMLSAYGELIVKPTGSYGGDGVLMIKALGADGYLVQDGTRKKHFSGESSLYAYVRRKARRAYIVQRRIPLATVKGQPYDLRVMVQRKRGSSWKVTGKLAKIAGKGYIITNMRRSHGRIVPVSTAIRKSNFHGVSTSRLLDRIDSVALETAGMLKRRYSHIRCVGVDMGLDKEGNVWIIEANFLPMKELFLKLKDKSMYRRIVKYSS
jgi:hypothetical protein